MQHIQYQHLNKSKYISMRYMPATDSEYEQYARLARLGYSVTTEHDGDDRVLVTVGSNRGHYPLIEKFCSYADIHENIRKAICSLYVPVIIEGVTRR